MHKLYTLLAALLLAVCAHAHNATIQGYVLSESGRQPLQNVTVSVEGSGSTLTDALGFFSLRGLQEGTVVLSFTSIGYETQLVTVQADESLTPAPITVRLKRGALQLSSVSVTGSQQQADVGKVSDLDMALRPVRTTQDMLRLVPGLFIAQHAGGGKAEQIFLRGFDCDHGTDVNITVDGMPVNMVSHAHGQGYADLHWVIPEAVDNFRFGKGPYFADKGDFATAGFVAFRTKDALDESLVKVEAGNFGTFRGVALLRMPLNENGKHKQYGYIGGEAFFSRGPFQSPQHFQRFNLVGKYSYYLNPNNRLTLSATHFRSSWDASGQIPERAVDAGIIDRFGSLDPTEGGNTGRTNVNLQLYSQLKGGGSLTSQVYYSHYDFKLFSNFTFFLHDTVNGDQIRQRENRSILGYSSILNKETHIGDRNLSMQYGVGLRYDMVDDISLAHTVRRQFLNNIALGDVNQLNAFAWASGTLAATRNFSVNGALRYDHIAFRYTDRMSGEAVSRAASAGRLSPKLNFYYNAGKNVRLFLNTGIGFHSNDARVAVPQDGRQVMPPAYAADLGAAIKAGDRLLVTPTLWFLQLDQEFIYVGDEAVLEPGGKTRRVGADLSLRYQVLDWLFADVDVNYAHGRALGAPKGEDYIPLAPTFTSIGGLTAQFKNGFRGAIRYRYISDRPANEDNSETAHGYLVNDLTAGYRWKRYDLGLAVENLFNVDWNEAQFDTETRLRNEPSSVTQLCYTPGTPFYIRLSLAVRF